MHEPGNAPRPEISVCIVTGRRARLLDACLQSLEAQVEAPPFELLVCSDGDPGVESTVRRRFPTADVVTIPRALPGAARNLLVERAKGGLLLFLDDDVAFPNDLLARYAAVAAARPGDDVFGGPNETPRGSTRFQAVQGAVLASLVASGPVRRRYGRHPGGHADERWFILCNLAVRRDAMDRFEDDIVCAEENALLTEMHRRGLSMYYDPALAVYHERRSDLRGFIQQMHKYGRGRGQLIARKPWTLHPAFLLPSAVVLYLVVAPVLAFVSPWLLLPGLAYAAFVAAGALRVATTLRRLTTAPLAAVLMVLLHVAYGTGVVRGLLRPRTSVGSAAAPEWSSAARSTEP